MWTASGIDVPGVTSVSQPGVRTLDPVGSSIAQRLQELPQVTTLLQDGSDGAEALGAQSSDLQQVLTDISSDLQQYQVTSSERLIWQSMKWQPLLQGILQDGCRRQAEQTLSKQEELSVCIDQTEALATAMLGKMQKSNLLLTAATKQLHSASQELELTRLQQQIQDSTAALHRLQGLAETTKA